MLRENSEIQGFLDYYYNLRCSPQYAVMLTGGWGAGKTWFIERSIESSTQLERVPLYVSLYGITSTQQIDDELFRLLHPVLGSKAASFAGRLIKGALKASVKIDLDIKKSEATFEGAIPEIEIPEFLKSTNGLVLIFDDLERCSIAISDILGYINYFVEHGECKVVILCNEEELLKKAGRDSLADADSYIRIKEKLVGRTFEVCPDVESAVAKFVGEIDLESTRETIVKNLDVVKRTYADSEFKNLRHLRQGIFDLARLVEILDAKILKNSELLVDFIRYFLLLSFEIKSGEMAASDIPRIPSGLYASIAVKKETVEENFYSRLSKKHSGLSFHEMILPVQLWQRIFTTGIYPNIEINQALLNSRYFSNSNQPHWVKLWNAFSLEDDEFSKILPRVDHDFKRKEFKVLGELKHVVSTLMMLSECGVYNESKDEILNKGVETLEAMRTEGLLVPNVSKNPDFLSSTGYAGMGFHDVNSDHFLRFLEESRRISKVAVGESYPGQSEAILQLMKEDTEDFASRLVHNNYKAAEFVGVPILSFINPADFVRAIASLNNEQMRVVSYVFKDRYQTRHYMFDLVPESTWLNEVLELLRIERKRRETTISGVLMRWIEDAMVEAIKKFENIGQ